MGDFFQGWRRKIGVVALVLALLLTGAWIKSEVRASLVQDPLVDWREFPFWYVITPLTLLSSYLLLRKP